MNTYLLPVSNDTECWIEHCYARDINSAEQKFIDIFKEAYQYDLDVNNFYELCDQLQEKGIIVGDIYDNEEF